MECQIKFAKINEAYSYTCINGGKVGDMVIVIEGKLIGWEGTISAIGRGAYKGNLLKCWRPEFDETIVDEWISLNWRAK